MAVKILVVDDSTTMRKIMAMTFAAESAQVETVGGVDAALQKLDSFAPDVVFADLSMSPDGYELAKAVKAKNPNTAVIALSSQHAAFDAAKGGAAGIDDNIVKPFDTQSVIDRVAQVLARPRAQLLAGATLAGVPQTSAAAPAAGAVAAPRPPMTAPASSVAIPLAASPRDMKRTMAFGMPLAPIANPVGPVQGATPGAPTTNTVSIPNPAVPAGPAPVVPRPAGAIAPQPAPVAPAPVAAAPAPAPAPAAPKPVAAPAPVPAPAPAVPKPAAPAAAPVAAPAPAASSPVAVVAGAVVSASLATKLGGLGLTKDQIEGVLALSREIVEQVVWEVVPELAETMIREEIKRLTAG